MAESKGLYPWFDPFYNLSLFRRTDFETVCYFVPKEIYISSTIRDKSAEETLCSLLVTQVVDRRNAPMFRLLWLTFDVSTFRQVVIRKFPMKKVTLNNRNNSISWQLSTILYCQHHNIHNRSST